MLRKDQTNTNISQMLVLCGDRTRDLLLQQRVHYTIERNQVNTGINEYSIS